jgi:hypothetical protein
VLDPHPAVECGSNEHRRLYPIGAAAVVVYVVGVPLLFFGALHRASARASFADPTP